MATVLSRPSECAGVSVYPFNTTARTTGGRGLLLRAGTEQRLTLSRNTALILDGSYNRTEGQAYLQGGLSLQLHF